MLPLKKWLMLAQEQHLLRIVPNLQRNARPGHDIQHRDDMGLARQDAALGLRRDHSAAARTWLVDDASDAAARSRSAMICWH